MSVVGRGGSGSWDFVCGETAWHVALQHIELQEHSLKSSCSCDGDGLVVVHDKSHTGQVNVLWKQL